MSDIWVDFNVVEYKKSIDNSFRPHSNFDETCNQADGPCRQPITLTPGCSGRK